MATSKQRLKQNSWTAILFLFRHSLILTVESQYNKISLYNENSMLYQSVPYIEVIFKLNKNYII